MNIGLLVFLVSIAGMIGLCVYAFVDNRRREAEKRQFEADHQANLASMNDLVAVPITDTADIEAFEIAAREGYILSRTGWPEPLKQWKGTVPAVTGLWASGDSPAGVVSTLNKLTPIVREYLARFADEAEAGETIDVTDMTHDERMASIEEGCGAEFYLSTDEMQNEEYEELLRSMLYQRETIDVTDMTREERRALRRRQNT